MLGDYHENKVAYVYDHFAAVLPSAAIDFLSKHSEYTVEVTPPLSPVREKGMVGAIAPPVSDRYVLGSKVPSDFSSRTFNVVYKSVSVPIPVNGGGSAAAYWLMGRKWTQTDPQVKLSIKDDVLFAATGLSKKGALDAVSSAAKLGNGDIYGLWMLYN